jgi:hypothetical protein
MIRGDQSAACQPDWADASREGRHQFLEQADGDPCMSTGKTFTRRTLDGGIEVTVPPLLAKEVPCQHAGVLKLTNVQ